MDSSFLPLFSDCHLSCSAYTLGYNHTNFLTRLRSETPQLLSMSRQKVGIIGSLPTYPTRWGVSLFWLYQWPSNCWTLLLVFLCLALSVLLDTVYQLSLGLTLPFFLGHRTFFNWLIATYIKITLPNISVVRQGHMTKFWPMGYKWK